MPLSRLRLIFLTILLAVVALWFTNQQNQKRSTSVQEQTKPLPYSWQTENTTIWKVSPKNPEQQTIIESQKFVYKEEQKISEFSQPKLQLINGNNITQLTSETGHSTNNTDITFKTNVIVTQTENRQTTGNRLTTEKLTFHQTSNRVTTDAKVTISQYNGQTSGIGLEADLDKAEYKLLSNVEGQYNPQKINPNKNPLKGQ